MEVRRMEIDEMVEAGVDFSNPDNYHTYTFSVELKFRQDSLPIVFEGTCVDDGTGKGQYIQKWEHTGPGINYPSSGETIGIMTFPVVEKLNQVRTAEPVFIYLTTTQSVSWLKEMYNVDLAVYNEANYSYPIENASATLNLPQGVSLAQLVSGQDLVKHMETIPGGGTGYVNWIVKGDVPGKYELSANFHGTLSPFDAPIDAQFKTDYEFQVQGGEGIHIIVMPEKARYIGEKYYIQFRIVNESNRSFYNFSTTIGSYENTTYSEEVIVKDWQTNQVVQVKSAHGRTYHVPNSNKCKVLPITYGGDTVEIGVFEPGDEIYGTYVAKDKLYADGFSKYYRLVDYFVECLEGENLGVKVSVDPIQSHMYKYVLYVNCAPIPGDYEYYGDPIDTTTGAFIQNIDGLNMAEDAIIPFSVRYNSLMGETKGEAGYGTSHDYEQRVEYNGSTITYYSSPYASCTFYNELAMKNTTFGRVLDNKVVLDESREYTGNFYSATTEMSEYTVVRNEDKTITITSPTGEMLYFDADGKLTSIQKTERKIWDLTRAENLLTVTDRSSGKAINIRYNEQGYICSVTDYYDREETFEYDDAGNLVKITNPAGNSSKYGYDHKHHLTTASNENGVEYLRNTYDEKGRVTEQWQPDSGTNATLTYKDPDDKKEESENSEEDSTENKNTEIRVKDHRGGEQVIITNQYGQRISKKDQNGNTSNYNYDMYGNLLTESGEEGTGSMYRYDANGNMTDFIDYMGNVTQMTYDATGNLTSIDGAGGDNVSYQHDKYHNITSSTDYKGMVTKYEYNEQNQLIKETVEGLGSKTYSYQDGQLVSYTDYNGNKTEVFYDDYGNICTTTNALGQETTYEYDILGRRTKVVEPSGIVTSYTYDNCGNVLTETVTGKRNGKTLTTTYNYDLMGRMVSSVDAQGTKTQYEYDGDGNLLKVSYPDGTTEEYEYDAVGNKKKYKDAMGVVTTYKYDGCNRLISETTDGNTTTYSYYGNGKIQKETYPDGQTMEYLYDNNWNVVQTTKNETYSSSYKTDLAGKRDLFGT